MANFILHFDGSCGPKNPGGTAAYGFTLAKEGTEEPIRKGSGVIGTGEGMTNNLAEFAALYEGLSAYREAARPGTDNLTVYGDSKLVIEIMNKRWKAKATKPYYTYYFWADSLVRRIRTTGSQVTFTHIGRELNQVCDDLSKAHQEKRNAAAR